MKPWRGDPADIVVEFDPRASARAFADWIATLTPRWHRDALCREHPDLTLWFPAKGQPTRPALEICARCPVRAECLAEALADPELDHGVRGGMTARARTALRHETNGDGRAHRRPTHDRGIRRRTGSEQ